MARFTALLALGLMPVSAAANAAVPTPAVLLSRHAPLLVLHPQERFAPTRVEPFLDSADLLRREGSSWVPYEGGIESATTGTFRLDVRGCTTQDAVAALDCYAALGGPPTAYGAVHRRSGRIVLQYWLFYPYNLWSPVVPQSPDFWQAHEGDWEQVSIVLDAAARPLAVAVSRHCGGVRRAWRAVSRRGQRPVLYVSLGSHANGFRPGSTALDPRCWPMEAVAIYRAYRVAMLDHAGEGKRVVPQLVRVSALLPAWMRFTGTWGEDRYAHFPNATFRHGAGPTGPAQKQEWRDPLSVLRWPPG